MALSLEKARQLYRNKRRTRALKKAIATGAVARNAAKARDVYRGQARERGAQIDAMVRAGKSLAEAAEAVGMNYSAASRCRHAFLNMQEPSA